MTEETKEEKAPVPAEAPVEEAAPAAPPVQNEAPATPPAPAVEVEEVGDDRFIQVNLSVGKHGGKTVRQGVVLSKDQAEVHKDDLKEMVSRQLSRQIKSAVDEIFD